jgi:hypothetical protein
MHKEGIMEENPLEPGPQDYDRVNVLDEVDLEYWTRAFGVTREQLAMAIQDVGPAIPDLEQKLGPLHAGSGRPLAQAFSSTGAGAPNTRLP